MVDAFSGLVILFQSDRRSCAEVGLVLESAGIPWRLHVGPGSCAILVRSTDEPEARREIDTYQRENEGWNAKRVPISWGEGGWWGVGGYALVIIFMAIVQWREWWGLDWTAAGKTSVVLIDQGELWRTMTALTLHSDLPHLAANLVAGGLFGRFAGQMLGSGMSWLAILWSGAIGNYLNAMIRPEGHTSIGASTAVFAALGLVAAFVWRRKAALRTGKIAVWAPVAGGLALLGLLGTGGGRTDVGAHLTGFISGLFAGVLLGLLWPRIRWGRFGQWAACTLALLSLGAAWGMALIR